MPHAYLEAFLILVLIMVNGFFAMSEMALVAARKVRLEAMAEQGSRTASLALRLKARPESFLSTAQIGITLVAILTGAISGATIAARAQDLLASFAALEPYSRPLGLALVVVPITYLTLVLGELVPKKLAVSHPERMSDLAAPVMYLLMRVAAPAVAVLSLSIRGVVRLLGIRTSAEPTVTEEDIRGLIREAVGYGEVRQAEREILDRVFRLDDMQVGEVMTRAADIVWLDPDEPPAQSLRKVLEHPHSRFPVARREPLRILGVLKAKEYLGAWARNGESSPEAQLHQLESVPATMRVLRLLELFRQKDQMHFALVVDEYDHPQGVVTFNDILEAMVGDIPTVHARPEPAAVRRDDGTWLLDGVMPLDEVQDTLRLARPLRREDQTFQTLAGFVRAHTDNDPRIGKHFVWHDHHFEIVDMDGQRIDRILVSPPKR